jgi:transcriptional regulator with XRE-family HTH domain
MIKPIQIKMARAALGWGVRELASAAGVTPNTVSRCETAGGGQVATIEGIQTALEKAGVIFIKADETGGVGVRLSNGS